MMILQGKQLVTKMESQILNMKICTLIGTNPSLTTAGIIGEKWGGNLLIRQRFLKRKVAHLSIILRGKKGSQNDFYLCP